MVRFVIPGPPGAKGRPKFSVVNGHAHVRTPAKTVEYENLVRLEYQMQAGNFRFPDGASLIMTVIARFPIPKSYTKSKRQKIAEGNLYPSKKPDWDNIGKVVSDALNKIAYDDDSAIVEAHTYKEYSDKPEVEVILFEKKQKNVGCDESKGGVLT